MQVQWRERLYKEQLPRTAAALRGLQGPHPLPAPPAAGGTWPCSAPVRVAARLTAVPHCAAAQAQSEAALDGDGVKGRLNGPRGAVAGIGIAVCVRGVVSETAARFSPAGRLARSQPSQRAHCSTLAFAFVLGAGPVRLDRLQRELLAGGGEMEEAKPGHGSTALHNVLPIGQGTGRWGAEGSPQSRFTGAQAVAAVRIREGRCQALACTSSAGTLPSLRRDASLQPCCQKPHPPPCMSQSNTTRGAAHCQLLTCPERPPPRH